MAKVKLKRKSSGLIITYKLSKQDQVNVRYMEILKNDIIAILLPIELHSGVGGKKLRVRVANCIDLASYVRSNLSFSEFLDLIRQIINAVHVCESHGLRASNLDFNPQRAFYDDNRNVVQFIYRPMIVLDEYANLPSFLLKLGQMYEPGNDQIYKNKYLELLKNGGKFDAFWFQANLSAIESQWSQGASQFPGDSDGAHIPSVDLTKPFFAYLIHLRTRKKIDLESFPFSIGRKPDLCSYAIEDNMYIGRKHVIIEQKNSKVYIRDNDSRNGTRLDGKLLPPQKEFELYTGCMLELGNEKFQFYSSMDTL